MPFDLVEQPLPSPETFGLEGDAAALSSAAVLLVLGWRLRGDQPALAGRASDGAGESGSAALPEEDVSLLNVPPLIATGERITQSEAQRGLPPGFRSRRIPPSLAREIARGSAVRLHAEPTHLRAAQLFEACLRHPEEVTRVAAASSYLDLTTDPRRPLNVLRRGLRSQDELAREVAAASLARFNPEGSALARFSAREQTRGDGRRSSTCILVHGTWGRGSAWWQPGGDFYQYFVTDVRGDVYSAPDRFSWSGGYSDAARAVGALDLLTWTTDHGLNGLDVFTHSHGGSVAMLATQGGLGIGELVLLSCPVHVPKYLPDFSQIGRAISVHVHIDLVILADGGGQKFTLPQIDEHVLPVWFDHFATHYPDVWKTFNIPQWL